MRFLHPFLRTLAAFALIVAALFASLPAQAAAAAPDAGADSRPLVRLGVFAYMGVDAARHEWRPLAGYLDSALPQYRFQLEFGDLDTLRRAVAAERLDFVLTNPGHYVELESAFGVSRIATLAHSRNSSANLGVATAVIAAVARSDLNTLEDVRGQRVAATAPEGFGGYQIAWRELADLRIDPQRDLKQLMFVGFPMQRVLQALDTGRADAGIVRACLIESRPEWMQRYKILSATFAPELDCTVSSRLYPNWPVASLRNTPPPMARAMAIALLEMEPGAHGIYWDVPADYQSVHEVFRDLKIGPYEHLRLTPFRVFVQKYWHFGAVILFALLCWMLYTLRSEYLVRTRTAALEQALHERHAFELRMRANQEQADHLARLSVLGELSSSLAHELSQPLAGVNNYAQSLLRRLYNGRLTHEAVREASENIVTLSHTAADILKRMKGFVRKRSAFRELRPLPPVVDDAVALFNGMQLHAPRIQRRNTLPDELQVNADPLQIQQILLNFFKNAQDAMQSVPEEDQVIQITLEASDGWAWIHVRDNGVGMDAEQLRHLFEPFYTSKEDGLGIGLSICKRIAEAHGGQLQGTPGPDGRGMIFSLSLPIYERTAKPVDPPA